MSHGQEHMHVLCKASYGDFDIRQKTPLFVSTNRVVLEEKAAVLNAKRDPKEHYRHGEWNVSYVVEDQVKVLYGAGDLT